MIIRDKDLTQEGRRRKRLVKREVFFLSNGVCSKRCMSL